MTTLFSVLILSLVYFSISTLALQVTPNSPCASICIDNPSADVSDPNTSNTYGSDIVCTDAEYANTAVGQKFENCITCLQNSTANSTTESDQGWFLYNVRYAFTTCLFNAVNASESFSTPCSINSVCGSFNTVLETDLTTPSLQDQYGYCGAHNETFSSSGINSCENCLKENTDQKYLSNFLIALDAGCIQQPVSGVLLGLEGSLFSSNTVNITNPVVVTTPSKKKILTVAGISGIAAAGVVLLLILGACGFIWHRKRKSRRSLRFKSSLDDRYGSPSIGAPIYGAYNEPNPPKPTAYESVGLIKVPAPIHNSTIHDNFSPPGYDIQQEEYYNHNDPKHNHEELARNLGFRMSSGSPRRVEDSPSLASDRSAPDSIIHIDTPSTDGSSKNLYDKLRHLDTDSSKPKITTPQSSHGTSTPTTKPPPPTILPMNAIGLPKPRPQPLTITPIPQNFRGVTTTTTSTSAPLSMHPPTATMPPVQNFSRRHTRDLSASRDRRGLHDHYPSMARGENQISGPIVTVGTRFDVEDEVKRRMERERLYREGFVKKPEERQVRRRPSADSPDDNLW